MRYLAHVRIAGLDARSVRETVHQAWRLYGGPQGCTVEVALLDGEEHSRIHEEFLGDPTETDVLAFAYGDPDLFGEILVNGPLCVTQARARRRPPPEEALLYVAHGTLHILGFRDADDAARQEMRRAEARVLDAAARVVARRQD